MPTPTAIKWHGGKAYLAKEIVALMPPRCKNPNAPAADDNGYLHYVEPFAGGLSVLLANGHEGISEVVGDAHPALVNFWQVMADTADFQEFVRIIQATPFCECDYARAEFAWWNGESRADTAARFFIRCRQSMSGRMDSFAPLTRNRTRRGMNEQASAWWNAVEGLPAVHERLKRVVILNRPALEVIKQQDGPRSLFYCDPPYMHETRSTTKEYGDHEMSESDHRGLLNALAVIEGRFLLSGYHCDLYDERAKRENWRCVEFNLPNNAASGKTKGREIECVWMNY